MSSSLFILTLTLLTNTRSSCDVRTENLCVNQVIDEGFGNITNRYAWAMQPFKGSIYVSTLNAVNASAGIQQFFKGQIFETNGAQIYKGILTSDSGWSWTQIVTGGLGDIWNFGVRKFAVAGESMYGVTANYKSGFEIWRTDGDQFEHVMKGGFGDHNNTSGRGMGLFGAYLYIGTENRETGAQMYRRQVSKHGDFSKHSEWEVISDDGFGNRSNMWFSDMVKYKGYIYVGTLNKKGMQLWRSKESDGTRWNNVFRDGNGLRANVAVMKLCVYNKRLYFGTMNQIKGASLWVNDDSEGLSFVPVFDGGNGNRRNSYIWNLHVFNGRLYAGTLDISDNGHGVNGFDLYSSEEAMPGSKWVNETVNGFGHPQQVGVRTIGVTDDDETMLIGSATANDTHGCVVFAATLSD